MQVYRHKPRNTSPIHAPTCLCPRTMNARVRPRERGHSLGWGRGLSHQMGVAVDAADGWLVSWCDVHSGSDMSKAQIAGTIRADTLCDGKDTRRTHRCRALYERCRAGNTWPMHKSRSRSVARFTLHRWHGLGAHIAPRSLSEAEATARIHISSITCHYSPHPNVGPDVQVRALELRILRNRVRKNVALTNVI